MVASVGRITSGSGYEYLTSAVARDRHDYYTGAGEAPGVWTGRGRHELELEGLVDAKAMEWLYGSFVDPRSLDLFRLGPNGRPLGIQILGGALSSKPKIINQGTGAEKVLEQIAAFDVTFSPAKSVSVLWALHPDEAVRNAVIAAHEHAVDAGLAYLEANASHSRVGRNGVRRMDSSGFIVAKFRHRTSRTTDPSRVGDPQLHTHCAILNRVHCADGKWRTLDSQAIFNHTHAAGALYATVLEAELTRTLGVAWVTPDKRVPMREIAGIPDDVVAHFSSRRQQVTDYYAGLEAAFRTERHRTPTRAERADMLGEATLRSRLGKVKGDGTDLHDAWAATVEDSDIAAVAATAGNPLSSNGGRMVAGSPELADAVFASLHGQRSWWTRVHMFAEVARLIDTDVVEAIELEVERLIGHCVNLEPDRDPAYAQPDRTKFTSHTILAAEHRILNAAAEPAEWHVGVEAAHTTGLGDDQAAAVRTISESDHQLATVVGPAGAGKTTMLKAVGDTYATAQRPVTVLALAANAAQVVTEETGMDANTIAAWQVGQVQLPQGGLVIVDEASMVPTLTLDRLICSAREQHCRVALVGDYAQMGAPEAGGLLHDLSALPSAVELTEVRRFVATWERDASQQLRRREDAVTDTYLQQGRILATTAAGATDSIVRSWVNDIDAGRTSMIVVDTNEQAGEVSARCQQHLIIHDRLGDEVGRGADGNQLRVGDLVQTRSNDKRQRTSDGRRVLNRDLWRVTSRHDDGTMTVTHQRRHSTAQLSAEYVADHVVLAYATTIAGAQGRTVDTSHTLVTPRTAAAALYVGLTRGRHANHAHVITDGHHHEEFGHGTLTARNAFAAALRRTPEGQLSANAVRARWAEQQPQREAEAAADRAAQAAAEWWTRETTTKMRDDLRGSLQPYRSLIVRELAKAPSTTWPSIAKAANLRTDWRGPDAPRAFVRQIVRGARDAEAAHREAPAQPRLLDLPTQPTSSPSAHHAR